MNFCCHCGAPLAQVIPEGDDRLRGVCVACKRVHYDNPRVLVAAFLYFENKLLWTRRGTEPQQGLWAFPAGFLEKGETLQQAAVRELFEETRIRKSSDEMFLMSLGSVVSIDQLYIVFRSPCVEQLAVQLTRETEAWGWFDRAAAPWDRMAHPETETQVRQVYRWVEEGKFGVRVGEVTPDGGEYTVLPVTTA